MTVLYPFVPPAAIDETVLDALAQAAASVPQFRAECRTTGWFDEEVLWLAPEPAPSFRALTTAVWRAFPDCQPYEGRFDDIVPHLTIGQAAPLEELRAGRAGGHETATDRDGRERHSSYVRDDHASLLAHSS